MRSPEQDLILAVVKTAVDDLTSTDEFERFEAFQFFLQEKGSWADSRREYFSLIGLDEESVLHALRDKLLDPPEKPSKNWTMYELYDVLPSTPFKASDLRDKVDLRYMQMAGRLHHLMASGHIVRLNRGKFIRADCHDAWRAQELKAIAPPPPPAEPPPPSTTQAALLYVLRDGPKTVREIGFAFDGEVGVDAIKQRLQRAAARGLIEKDGSAYRLAA